MSIERSPDIAVTHVVQVHSFSIDKVDYSSRHLSKLQLIVGNVLAVACFLTLIPLFIIRLFRPLTDDFIECDRVDTKKTSRSAPPPYEEIDKNNAVSDSDRH
jgi:hypothetical protein